MVKCEYRTFHKILINKKHILIDMKTNSRILEITKKVVVIILILMGCFILIDLYVPIKRLVMGDNLNLSEILSYVELKRRIPIVIAISVGIVYGNSRKSS